jgi:hypothetical protein
MTTRAPAMIRVRQGTRGEGRCSGCGAPLVWFETERGARHPFNVGYRLEEQGILEPVEPGARRQAVASISAEFSHFATCPHADRFRSRSSGKARGGHA